MRRIGLLLASSAVALAACNALTGAADLAVCATCGDDDAALAPAVQPDVFVAAPVDASRDALEPVDAPGDGVVDALPDAPLSCNGVADCERVVFVTSTAFPGNLGGVAGADAKCQALADLSSNSRVKGRTFLAWVSTNATSPAARFVHGTKAYVRVDKAVVASTWNELLSGTLRSGIGLDENGAAHSGQAWTGTRSETGQLSTSTCADWTSSSFAEDGVGGNVGGSGGGWSSNTEMPCASTARIYCFEK